MGEYSRRIPFVKLSIHLSNLVPFVVGTCGRCHYLHLFRIWKSRVPRVRQSSCFIWGSALSLVLAYFYQIAFLVEFPFDSATDYAAFLQNALMSTLFIAMFYSRGGTRGQNLIIAVSKWLGTLAATILRSDRLVRIFGIICCVLDVICIGLLMWPNYSVYSAVKVDDQLESNIEMLCPNGELGDDEH